MGGLTGTKLPEWLSDLSCGECGAPLKISGGMIYRHGYAPKFNGRELNPYLEVEGIIHKRFYITLECSNSFSTNPILGCFWKNTRIEVDRDTFLRTVDYVNAQRECDRDLKISDRKKDRFVRRE